MCDPLDFSHESFGLFGGRIGFNVGETAETQASFGRKNRDQGDHAENQAFYGRIDREQEIPNIEKFTRLQCFELIKSVMDPTTIEELELRTFKVTDKISNKLFKIYNKVKPITDLSDIFII